MTATRIRSDRSREISERGDGLALADFDPEDDGREYGGPSNSELEENGAHDFDGREYYANVEKSKLRGREATTLGSQYAGTRVKRKGLEEKDEEHDPFAGYGSAENSDQGSGLEKESEASDADEVMSAYSQEGPAEEELEDMRSDMRRDNDDDSAADSDIGFDMDAVAKQARKRDESSQLKSILANDKASFTNSLATSHRADAQKGTAVLYQRRGFDALLNSRIRLQNGLVALNTLPTVPDVETHTKVHAAVQTAEAAARKLWSTLDSFRTSLVNAKAGSKRKRLSENAAVGELWTHMSDLEASAQPNRRSTLARWSDKTTPIAQKAARTSANSLSSTKSKDMGLLDLLDGQLADTDRLVKKARVPRSMAPAQAKAYTAARRAQKNDDESAAAGVGEAKFEDIYDDADFYSALLKDLLAQRQLAAPTATNTNGFTRVTAGVDLESEYRSANSKSAAAKKTVDTRASKGRKMRYTVHEKLVNFMVPHDRGAWNEKQRSELFGSLFGSGTGHKKSEGLQNDDEAPLDKAEGALKLFRGR